MDRAGRFRGGNSEGLTGLHGYSSAAFLPLAQIKQPMRSARFAGAHGAGDCTLGDCRISRGPEDQVFASGVPLRPSRD